MATLNDKSVGDIVKIKENGVYVNYIIIQKGNPDASNYDSSCDGIWLMRQYADSQRAWNSTLSNDYENSSVHSWLNGTFLNRIDSGTKAAIKTVKIPYMKGQGKDNNPMRGSNGLSCKVFLLALFEICQFRDQGDFNSDDYGPSNPSNARLSYFKTGEYQICTNSSGTKVPWWTRTPDDYAYQGHKAVYYINSDDKKYWPSDCDRSYWVRPVFILPATLTVNTDGTIVTNTAPTITASKSGNLGTLTNGFDLTYSVNDADGNSVTVTERLDSRQIRSYTATLGRQETYSLSGTDWISLANGSHTFSITASDGTDTVTHTVTFTRNNRAPVIGMSQSGDVGTLTDGFDLTYSVSDEDGDAVTVTETLDNEQIRQFSAVLGQQESYSLRGTDWLKVENGQHTFQITANDGQQTSTTSFAYTRNQTSLSVTLSEPLDADDRITACSLNVEGLIPEDAVCKYEVTNNALDSSPVWEDCTAKSKSGLSYLFDNKTAENGFAFNFRVSISRGESGTGGYITEISGGFE